MSEWLTKSLGEICRDGGGFIRTGPFGSQLHRSDYTDDPNGIPVVMPKDMARGRIDTSSVARIDQETAGRLKQHLLAADDLVLARRGDVGRTAWVFEEDLPAFCGTGSMRVHPGKSESVRPSFLRFFFHTKLASDYLEGHAVGATMPNLNAGIVESLPVPIPPLSIQDSLVAVLEAFDELIENNRRRVEVLEEIARVVYREWFVKFRYPGHGDVPLVDSAVGPIPDGWEVRTLGDVSRNLDRFRKPLSKMQRDQRRGTFPYYGAAKLLDLIDDWIFDGEYLLFAEDGSVETPLGYPVLQMIRGRFWANNHTHILEGADVSTRFLRLAVERVPIRPYVTGAAQPKITQANLKRIPVLVANNRLHESFDNVIDPIFDEVHTINRVTGQLIALRDLLLPKLVSGQIDVSMLDLEPLVSRLGAEAPRTSTSGGSVA